MSNLIILLTEVQTLGGPFFLPRDSLQKLVLQLAGQHNLDLTIISYILRKRNQILFYSFTMKLKKKGSVCLVKINIEPMLISLLI